MFNFPPTFLVSGTLTVTTTTSFIHLLTCGWRIKRVDGRQDKCVRGNQLAVAGDGGGGGKKKEKSALLPRTTYKSAFDPDKKVDPATCGDAVSAQHQLSISSLAQILAVLSFLLFFLPPCWQLVNAAKMGTCCNCQPVLTSAGSLFTPLGLHSDGLSVTCSICHYSSTWLLRNEKKKIKK